MLTNGAALTKEQDLSSTESEEHDAVDLGYKQVMPRSRGLFHILFMSLAILAVPYALVSPIVTSLTGGGPVTIFWGWLLVSILTLPTTLSLAEMASKWPTSAGPYYWCYKLAGPAHRVVLSWIGGWLNLVGMWCVSLSVGFGMAQMIVAGVVIFSGSTAEWEATPAQTYFIFVGVMFFSCGVCVFFNRWLPMIDVLSAVWTLAGIIVIAVCVSVKAAAGRRSANFAFVNFDAKPSGWTAGWAFFVGLLPPAYTYSGIGIIACMAEEVKNPAVQIPRAMIWSIPTGAITGIIFLLPILFTLPDISSLLAVSSGQPIGVMFTLIMGSPAGAFGMWFIIFGITVFCAISISCAASRATWSFARDKALPFHHLFSKVAGTSGNGMISNVPLNALLLSTAVQLLLGLIYLGSSAAFNAFVGVSLLCLGSSYALPVGISLWNGRRVIDDVPGPFHLGRRWGGVINSFAVAWALFEVILFSMPSVLPVTPASMNYTSVVFVGFGCLSAAWYFINGRRHFRGPPVPVQEENAR